MIKCVLLVNKKINSSKLKRLNFDVLYGDSQLREKLVIFTRVHKVKNLHLLNYRVGIEGKHSGT